MKLIVGKIQEYDAFKKNARLLLMPVVSKRVVKKSYVFALDLDTRTRHT